jgi:hypothetical protein
VVFHRKIFLYTYFLSLKGEKIEQIEHSAKLVALRDLLYECGIGKESINNNNDKNNSVNIPEELPHRVLIFCQQKCMYHRFFFFFFFFFF